MTAAENWIESSLLRLESLEQEREQLETDMGSVTDPNMLEVQSAKLEELDEEIRGLYEALEAAAADSDGQAGDAEPAGESSEEGDAAQTGEFQREAESEAAAAEPAQPAAAVEPPPAVETPAAVEQPAAAAAPVAPAATAPAAAPAAEDEFDPFGPHPSASQAAASAPAGLAPSASTSNASAFDAPSAFDSVAAAPPVDFDDEPKKGGALKWVALLVLVAGGGGAFAYMQQQKAKEAEAAAAAPAGPAKVINAGPVLPDTQGHKGADGSEAAVTPSTEYESGGGGGGKANRGGHRGGGSKGKKKKDGRAIDITKTDDPLAGAR